MNNNNDNEFSKWYARGRNVDEQSGKLEYYEDTHKDGVYVGSDNTQKAMSMPNKSEAVAPRQYQNLVIYNPKTPEDVEVLIDYLKRREPAIANLDSCDPADAQRILDFTSGAVYALGGTMQRIATNIFVLSPEGVEIKTPYEV